MKKLVRQNEAKLRERGNSGLKEVPANRQKDAPWADHRPVDPKHVKETP